MDGPHFHLYASMMQITPHIITVDWPAPSHIRAFSTTRQGGHSQGAFASLNLGDHVGDVGSIVQANRALLASHLEIPGTLRWLNQVHGNQVINLDTSQPTLLKPDADASYTRTPHQICVIGTADCLPILLCDDAGTEIAAIHGGWRSLALGIIGECVRYFRDSSRVYAWLGPHISQKHFEVGSEVRTQFLRQNPAAESCFQMKEKDKWLGNLRDLAIQQLHREGISQIFGGSWCTYSDAENFFSHRRDKITGRMATFIWIDNPLEWMPRTSRGT